MALSGECGAIITVPDGIPAHAWLFGEDQGRYLITTADGSALAARAEAAGIPAATIGKTTDSSALTVGNASPISLATLRAVNEDWLPDYMAG